MFSIGLSGIGRFNIWVSEAAYSKSDYYEVLVSELMNGVSCYVNLHKDPRFDCVSFKYPPPPHKIKSKKNKQKNHQEEDDEPEYHEETPEQIIYRQEHRIYNHRWSDDGLRMALQKGMPMWHLHRSTIEKVFTACIRISSNVDSIFIIS